MNQENLLYGLLLGFEVVTALILVIWDVMLCRTQCILTFCRNTAPSSYRVNGLEKNTLTLQDEGSIHTSFINSYCMYNITY